MHKSAAMLMFLCSAQSAFNSSTLIKQTFWETQRQATQWATQVSRALPHTHSLPHALNISQKHKHAMNFGRETGPKCFTGSRYRLLELTRRFCVMRDGTAGLLRYTCFGFLQYVIDLTC